MTSTLAPPPLVGASRAAPLALLVSAQFVVMLDTSIVNVALPTIHRDLDLAPDALSWVVNSYVLAFGGLLLLLGRVADLVGRRRMFVAGSALFTVGTMVASMAANELALVGGRVVQGIGAAALSPAAMSLLLVNFPGEHKARAMSLWGAASALGGATGVLAGGLLAGSFGWPSVFLVTVPVTMAGAALARRVLADGARGTRRRFDVLGAVTVTGAVVALVHAALRVSETSWTDPAAMTAFAMSAALFAAFVAVEQRTEDPLVPLRLFRSQVLSTGIGLAVLGGATRASTFVLVALYLQQALHLTPLHAGLAMVPTSLAGFAVNLFVLPRVLRAVGPRRSLVAGLGLLAAGQLWLALAPGDGYLDGVLPGLLLVATGVALSFTPTTMIITSAAPKTLTGLASGLTSSATQVGAALGTAAFTAIALSPAGPGDELLTASGFSAAFTAAALVAVATAVLGGTIVRR